MKIMDNYKNDGSKIFDNLPYSIPNEMLNEDWAEKIHSQTLKRLDERGGMSIRELIINIKRMPTSEYRKFFDNSETTKADADELIKLLPCEPQQKENGVLNGLKRYNTEELYGEKLFTVKAVVMQDLKDGDYFWTNKQGGGFIGSNNKLTGDAYDNLVVLVLAVPPKETNTNGN